MDIINKWNNEFASADPKTVLKFFINKHKKKIALASSLSIEDQVLTDIVLKVDPDTEIFTIDTGRLPEETYQLIDQTNERYNTKIKVYFPQSDLVENLVSTKGLSSFYESVENRKECCHIRKIEPLKRALSELDAWIVGLRREQSITRGDLKLVEYDDVNNITKINPLINWSENRVWDYIKENNIPYNTLFNQGYKSIGCAPCTRAIGEDEDVRAGRWWWENPKTKECGLHIKEVIQNG